MSVQCPVCDEQVEVNDFSLECSCGTKFVVRVDVVDTEEEE